MSETIKESSEQSAKADTIEAKIQNQFNEEKWTRISAKDISISRFNILEQLLNEAKKENELTEVQEIAREHLAEYEPSVAARYFLGMIALENNNHDNIVYLKQLLDQFEEIHKWSIVEYLSDKMLALNENRTILRAKATALEKLGKTKEVIPVLEKLARLDRKNPDIALKYADAILNEDLENAILFYKQAAESFAKNMQFEKLKIVWNKLVDLIPEDFTFYRKVERILAGHRQKDILVDLYTQLALYYIKQEDTDNVIPLCKKILEYNPGYTRFKNELIKAYREKYKDNSLLDNFIEYSGLLQNKTNISTAISNFETNIVFDKGNYVFHRSWGVGKIVDINTDEMIIDFKDKPNHRMGLQMALKSLKSLKDDHIWVKQFDKPEELEEQFKNDIVGFFKMLLSSFNNKISLADIKSEIATKYIPAKDWSKWWTKTRNEILKDETIGVSPEKRDVIILHDMPITQSEVLIDKFQAAQSFEDRISVLIQALKDAEKNEDALEYMLPFFKESLKALDIEIRLVSLWALDSIQEALGDEEPYYTPESKAELIKEFQELSIEELTEISQDMKQADVKKYFLNFIKENYEEWPKVFVEILFETPVKVHKTVMSELIQEGKWDEITEFLNRIRKQAKHNLEVFLWTIKNLISGTWQLPENTIKEEILSFFRVLKSVEKLEPKGTKLKNAVKDLLTGSAQEELFTAIRSYAKDSVRKLAALSRDIPYLSDADIDAIQTKLREIAPEAFDASDEDSLSAKNWKEQVAELEKSPNGIVTANAIEKMQEELKHLVEVEIPDNSKEIGHAQEKGDLRENAEYKAALERQGILQARVTKLENDLKNLKPLKDSVVLTDQVSIGSKVRLKDQSSGDIFVYTILDQWDADIDKGIISYKSPLGEAMLGHKVGDVIEFGTGKSKQNLEIIQIDKGIDSKGYLD